MCVENIMKFITMQVVLIRYTLDVMHCKQNVAKNILKTVTGLKDMVKVRRDMQRRGIWIYICGLLPIPPKMAKC